MPGSVQVIVLVEGDRDEKFVVAYLRKLGLKEHNWRISKSASGSGEQWVREHFATEVKAYRRHKAKAKTKKRTGG